jgi:predicted Zn-dependent protease
MDALEDPIIAAAARRKRMWIGLGIGIVVLGLIAAFGARPAYRQLKTWRAHRFVAEGEALLAQQKGQEAYGKAQAAFQLSPLDPPTVRLMARVLSAFGQEQAIPFWNQVLESGKATDADRRELAATAIRQRQWAIAEQQLNLLLRTNPPTVETLRLSSDFLLARGDIPQALRYARNAAATQPGDSGLRLFLGQRLLVSTNSAEQLEGKQTLLAVSAGSDTNALEATLLLASAVRLNPEEAASCAQRLLAHPARTLAHEFLAFDLQLRANPANRDSVIEAARRRYPPLGDEALLQLGRWLNRNREFERVLGVLSASKAFTSQDFFLVHLDALAGLGRWADVESALTAKNVPLDPFNIAVYRVRVAKELGQADLVPLYWTQAHRRAAENPQSLLYLAQYAERIGATEEAIKAWRRLTSFPNTSRMAFLSLVRLIQQASPDLRTLRDTLRQMSEQFPDDPAPRNDWAYLSLLLGEDIEAARAAATALVQKQPNMLSYRITLALGHLRAGDRPAAAKLLQGFQIDWTATLPGWQAVHAAVLAANGQLEEAGRATKKIPISQLKPQEKALIQALL